MKGVSFITDDKNRRKAMIIELKTIEDDQEHVEDLLDVIVAESRKNEPKTKLAGCKKVFEEIADKPSLRP